MYPKTWVTGVGVVSTIGRTRLAATAALGLGLFATTGCGLEPEERVRKAIREAVEAAEQERFEVLGGVISDRYADDGGRTRESLVDEARGYVERNHPAHFFTKERSLARTEPGRIEVELIVAMTSTPVESLRDLARLGADVGAVDLVFEEESDGEWRLVRARWRPATTSDFFPGRPRARLDPHSHLS